MSELKLRPPKSERRTQDPPSKNEDGAPGEEKPKSKGFTTEGTEIKEKK
jgi:hypothetical protein